MPIVKFARRFKQRTGDSEPIYYVESRGTAVFSGNMQIKTEIEASQAKQKAELG